MVAGRRHTPRLMAGLVAISLVAPLFGCGPSNNSVNAAPPQAPYNSAPQPQRQGLSTKQKVALLVGAAALYYMYKHHVNAQNQPTSVQYYRSRNGGVYYRDANHAVHWVTPPTQGISVPADQASYYQQQAQEQGFSSSVPSGSPGY